MSLTARGLMRLAVLLHKADGAQASLCTNAEVVIRGGRGCRNLSNVVQEDHLWVDDDLGDDDDNADDATL